jgi:putative sterol carrier protein
LPEIQTPQEFFEKVLPTRFNLDKTKGIDVTAQISITGKNGGNWVVTIKNQQIQVSAGTSDSPTVTVKMAQQDFMDMINKKLSAEKAFFTGKINFKGNIANVLQLKDAGLF